MLHPSHRAAVLLCAAILTPSAFPALGLAAPHNILSGAIHETSPVPYQGRISFTRSGARLTDPKIKFEYQCDDGEQAVKTVTLPVSIKPNRQGRFSLQRTLKRGIIVDLSGLYRKGKVTGSVDAGWDDQGSTCGFDAASYQAR